MNLHLKEGDDDLAENYEINVTPFIDVMLVLLIVFMVTAPPATVDIKINLPALTAKPGPRPEKSAILSVKSDRHLYLEEELITVKSLGPTLDFRTRNNKDVMIFIRADEGVEYGELMSVMDALCAAGYLKVGLLGLKKAAKT